MNNFPFADIRRELGGMFDRPSDMSIKVDSLASFTAALSEAIDLRPAKPEHPIKGVEFCGVQVVENNLVPPGMAVILHGSEIVNIIRYADSAGRDALAKESAHASNK